MSGSRKRSVDTAKFIHQKDVLEVTKKKIDEVNVLVGGTQCEKIRYLPDLKKKFSHLPIHLNLSVGDESTENCVYRLKNDTVPHMKQSELSPKKIVVCVDSPDAVVELLKQSFPEADVSTVDSLSDHDQLVVALTERLL